MNAKLTWPTLNETEKSAVQSRARDIFFGKKPISSADDLLNSTRSKIDLDQLNEFQRYSLYSIAMMEGMILSVTPERWNILKTPHTLAVSKKDIDEAAFHFKNQHNIDVTITL